MTETPLLDLHTHVLPAVDDGAPDLECALETLQDLQADGVVAVCATPHLRLSAASNPEKRARVDEAWLDLTTACEGRIRGLTLHRGFEILLDTPVFDFSDPALRLNGSRYVLVEWAAFVIPPESVAMIERLQRAGVRPIIAHAERFFGYPKGEDLVSEWRRRGALIQVNSGSPWGEHGGGAEKRAWRFLERGWVDLLASDTHARANRSPSIRTAYEALVTEGAREQAELLLSVNPRLILQDEPTAPVPPYARRGGWGRRLLTWAAGRRRRPKGDGG